MKPWLIFILLVCLMLSMAGCRDIKIEMPVAFFYIRSEYAYDEKGVLAPEYVEGSGFSDVSDLMEAYLAGPTDPSLVSLIPRQTQLLDIQEQADLLTVTFSQQLAALSGPELSLCCCALAKTLMEYTAVDAVRLQAENALLDGKSAIVVHAGDMLLYDDYDAATEGME